MSKKVKTSSTYCKNCTYSSGSYDGSRLCMYYAITGKHRNCEIGECDKFEKRKKGDEELHRRIWEDTAFLKSKYKNNDYFFIKRR